MARRPTPRKRIEDMTDDEVDALLTPEERADQEALVQGLADGTVVSITDPAELERHRAYAQRTMEKLERTAAATKARASATVNIRMTPADVQALHERADQLGMGYQTLLKTVVHQYLTGQLVSTSKDTLI